MIYGETQEYRDRDAVERVVAAARAFEEQIGPTRGKAWMDARIELSEAVRAMKAVRVDDLFTAIYERGQEAGREQERALCDHHACSYC